MESHKKCSKPPSSDFIKAIGFPSSPHLRTKACSFSRASQRWVPHCYGCIRSRRSAPRCFKGFTVSPWICSSLGQKWTSSQWKNGRGFFAGNLSLRLRQVQVTWCEYWGTSTPICSMVRNIYQHLPEQNHPNVGKYTIHGAYGYWECHTPIWRTHTHIFQRARSMQATTKQIFSC